jgi:hypothetical protein
VEVFFGAARENRSADADDGAETDTSPDSETDEEHSK